MQDRNLVVDSGGPLESVGRYDSLLRVDVVMVVDFFEARSLRSVTVRGTPSCTGRCIVNTCGPKQGGCQIRKFPI